jgi:valyl-tRNA synthetase
MLDKAFAPKTAEPRLYATWDNSGAFKPSDNPDAEPFSIVIPPPNVTGSLHIGHALNISLQDVLIRFERMRGKAALWVPGTDHAGIATQMVVERQLAASGSNISRRDMGREAFVEKIWAWKAQSGATIAQQLKRLGASCDWSRERFTLDEGLSAAVRKVFVSLYEQDLIYRDKRLVNWDPHFQTAISDLEVEQREVKGKMWHFAYPLEGAPINGVSEIVIATTRPETMLGDGAVAVHPDDERYKALVGRYVKLPIAERLIPIIADDYPDPEKGSGAVKITGAHDFNDYQVAKRHNLSLISIMDERAAMTGPIPERYLGKDRFEARQMVLAEIEAMGLLRQIEDRIIQQPHGDRSGVVIEPHLTDQWYVNASELAKEAIAAVEDGRTVFEPKNWEKTYFEWMRNIEPWCISRQLWWGHRIPVWYGPDGHVFVAEDVAQAALSAQAHYGKALDLRQDEDVLDTWFSSALWPFSTMGWPKETDDLARFYPTHTLITGFDIIFFWVARMMMMGLHFTGKVPFSRVFINALVRDDKGAKMSKSKGNVMDPLDLIDDFGADAVRFTLTIMSGQGRDLKLSKQRIEGYRNFGTKLWNAARFAEMHECKHNAGFNPSAMHLTLSRWILGEVMRTHTVVTKALSACAFDVAATELYRFVWNVFCDWYVELSKPILNADDVSSKIEIRAMTAWVLEQILVMLHPIMPFITEELWQKTGHKDLLISAKWPDYTGLVTNDDASDDIDGLISLITQVRSIRAEMNVPGSARPALYVTGASVETQARLSRDHDLMAALGRLSHIKIVANIPQGAVPFVVGEATAHLLISEFIDLKAEKARLIKEIEAFSKSIESTLRKLDNPEFVTKAPDEVIDENRERLLEAQMGKVKLEAALLRLTQIY